MCAVGVSLLCELAAAGDSWLEFPINRRENNGFVILTRAFVILSGDIVKPNDGMFRLLEPRNLATRQGCAPNRLSPKVFRRQLHVKVGFTAAQIF